MERPKSRVVSNEANEDPTVPRQSKGISARGIGENERGNARLVQPLAFAEDPKDVTMKVESMLRHQHQVAEARLELTGDLSHHNC
jgi:hypothetical protein